MLKHRIAILMAAAATATASALAAAPPAHAATTTFEIQSADSGWCLQPQDGSTAAGVTILQDTCNGSPAQQWRRAASSSGFHLVNEASGLCMDARGGAVYGTPIEQWPCDWISNENWKWIGGPQLASGVSGTYTHCVSIGPGGLFVPSIYVLLAACGGGLGQIWY